MAARKHSRDRSFLSELAHLTSRFVLSESTRLELEKAAAENAKRDMRDPRFRKRMSAVFERAYGAEADKLFGKRGRRRKRVAAPSTPR